MMVVSQDGLTIIPFDGGMWSVSRRGEIIFSAIGISPSDYRVKMAEYSSFDKAKLALRSMVQFYDTENAGYIFRLPKEEDVFALPMF